MSDFTRVFEKLGIEYCCGGNKSLEDACLASNRSVDQVIDSMEMAEEAAHAAQKDRNWPIEPLGDLIAHIKNPRSPRRSTGNLLPIRHLEPSNAVARVEFLKKICGSMQWGILRIRKSGICSLAPSHSRFASPHGVSSALSHRVFDNSFISPRPKRLFWLRYQFF